METDNTSKINFINDGSGCGHFEGISQIEQDLREKIAKTTELMIEGIASCLCKGEAINPEKLGKNFAIQVDALVKEVLPTLPKEAVDQDNAYIADILSQAIKEAGYVRLAKDQSLPDVAVHSLAAAVMLKEYWRKVEL